MVAQLGRGESRRKKGRRGWGAGKPEMGETRGRLGGGHRGWGEGVGKDGRRPPGLRKTRKERREMKKRKRDEEEAEKGREREKSVGGGMGGGRDREGEQQRKLGRLDGRQGTWGCGGKVAAGRGDPEEADEVAGGLSDGEDCVGETQWTPGGGGAAWVPVGTRQVWREWAICQLLSAVQGVRWGLWGAERPCGVFGESGVCGEGCLIRARRGGGVFEGGV